eukprot:5169389-Amphidinium_carterae.1
MSRSWLILAMGSCTQRRGCARARPRDTKDTCRQTHLAISLFRRNAQILQLSLVGLRLVARFKVE